MTVEDKLKDLILTRYRSIREFSIKINMSYSTMDSILRRGVGNSSVSNIIKICRELRISVDELADGNIVPISIYKPRAKGSFELEDVLTETKNIIGSDHLIINGKPVDIESKSSIVGSLEVAVEIAKRKVEA